MSPIEEWGKSLVLVGVVLLVLGLILTIGGKIPGIGRLPGDIYIEREGFTFYFPIVSAILISIIISIIINLLKK